MDLLTTSIDTYGLLAVVLIVLLKSAGVPIPVPNDALLLLSAVWVADGRQAWLPVFALLLVALVGGSLLQYWAVGGPARRLLDRFGPRCGLTPRRLSQVTRTIQRGGLAGFSLCVLTPGLRSLAVVAAALGRLPLRIVVPGLVLGNGGFLVLHFLLATAGLAAFGSLRAALPTAALVGVALIGGGLVGWLALRSWQAPPSTTGEVVAESVGAWQEACCPVCLLLGAVIVRPAATGEPERA